MTDLTTKLWENALMADSGVIMNLMYRAAEEIERLREALQTAEQGLAIALCWSDDDGTWVAYPAVVKACNAARAALGKGNKHD